MSVEKARSNTSSASVNEIVPTSEEKRQQPAYDQAVRPETSVFVPPPFKWSSLWSAPVINPVNLKCATLPILNFRSQECINFHLAWLGFFVAFLSWFAFPPLIPEAIKVDLGLTTAQVGNSNITALCATLVIRLFVGPIVDRYGPRRVMSTLLVLGAIPSGLAGTVTNYHGLLVIRFFIGILGATFVPCLVWTTVFFDKNIVGTANALVGGWGNMGGGVTYAVMVSLYHALHTSAGMSQHVAWRAAFAVVPVPILLLTAVATMLLGTDCPSGPWSARHQTPATMAAVMNGHEIQLDRDEAALQAHKAQEKEAGNVSVQAVRDDDEYDAHGDAVVRKSELDVAVNEALTLKSALQIFLNPLTWLPAFMYATTFGFELAVDSNLANDYLKSHPDLGMLNAGYLASIFGFLNLFTRPLGGLFADVLYAKFGVKSKVHFTAALGLIQGILCIGFGQWLSVTEVPSLAGMTLFVVAIAFANEMANGANFSLVPHCNAYNNGVMSGLVGAFGNVGGICFALVWRFHPQPGVAWWISGIIATVVNAAMFFWPKPKN
ncbi:putative high affinity nitrate transporter [Mrakia frigida]|uniref:MFS transporter n=1 Tax=Mrakia frigida TaxID=29902 RepID=UPI003FCC0777